MLDEEEQIKREMEERERRMREIKRKYEESLLIKQKVASPITQSQGPPTMTSSESSRNLNLLIQ